MTRDRGGRYGAVGHQGQDAQRAGVSAARRRVARGGAGLRPRERRDDRRRPWKPRPATSRAATRPCARSAACPGVADTVRRSARGDAYEPAERGPLSETVVEQRALSAAVVPPLFERLRRELGPTCTCCTTSHHRLTPIEAGASRPRARAVSSVLAGGSDAGGEPGGFRLIRQHTTTPLAVGRGVQLDSRLPPADSGTADRLHPHDRRARRRHQSSAEDRERSPSSIRCAPARTARPI